MSTPIRILLADAGPDFHEQLRPLLRRQPAPFALDWLRTPTDAEQAIGAGAHDAYLIDFRWGARGGLAFIGQALRQGSPGPFVLLTDRTGAAFAPLGSQAGAAYCLPTRGLGLECLTSCLRVSIQQARELGHLRQQNAALLRQLRQRSHQLEQLEARARQQAAESQRTLARERELHELKSRFITLASHEFRTPMGTILSSSALIERYNDGADAAKRSKHVLRIKSAVANLEGILQDFLVLDGLDNAGLPYVPVAVGLPAFVAEVAEEAQQGARPGQQVRYVHHGPPTSLTTDAQMLTNILLNLLANASKYSAEGQSIRLRTEVIGAELVLTVQDDGLGIPLDEQPRLFTDFFRARNAVHIHGTGLGLYIVKRYVERLGGRIGCASEQYVGSTFTVHLPVHHLAL